MASLKLENIYKKWSNNHEVFSFNIDIKDKEFIVFLGPSGCGKTTTLRMIAGLEEPTSGEILIGDRVVTKLEPKDRDIAMVFQNYGLYPHLSVYENIRFPLKIRNVDPSTHKERVLKAAQMVELDNLLNRKPKELSGGQRQRVALARAIIREPKVFLMDEPLSNLDAKLRMSTRAQIKNLHNKLKITTIYVTHDQTEAMTLADRIIVIDKGKIQQISTPKEIYNFPENTFVAGFIGSPPMNLVLGEMSQGTFRAPGIEIKGFNHMVKNKVEGEIILGFRAEDVEWVTENKKAQANTDMEVYSYEMLGDSTIVNAIHEKKLISFKADKNYQPNIDDKIRVNIPPVICHFFDKESGERLKLKK